MPRGASAKREREYKELKREFKKKGRYKGREEEVASRIVNKQRSRFGETKTEKKKDREGKSPDRDLPIPEYQHKTISQVERAIKSLSQKQLKRVERYAKEHKNRKTLLDFIHARVTRNGGGNSNPSRSHPRDSAPSQRRRHLSRSHSRRSKSHHGGTSGKMKGSHTARVS